MKGAGEERGELGAVGNCAPQEAGDLFDNLPGLYTVRRQWAVWRYENTDKPKPDKVPYNPHTRQRAKSNDPATWARFEDALAAFHRGGFDGISLGFATDDGLACIDLDHCRNAETGVIEPWALDIMDRFPGWYWEVSPRGIGLHGSGPGKLPSGRRKRGHVEMYDEKRFLTMTGQQCAGTALSLIDHSAELAVLHEQIFGKQEEKNSKQTQNGNGSSNGHANPLSDEELLILAKHAKNGARFSALYSGDTGSYPSPAEADLSLCSSLVFFCGPDSTRIDRLFRQSGLYRPKWDEKHFGDGRTYGEATIQKALAGTHEFYSASNGNGHVQEDPPAPDFEDIDGEEGEEDRAENIRMAAQEREEDPIDLTSPPDILWQGRFKAVAEKLNLWTWEIWMGVFGALCARAHRNLHAYYHSDHLYGMNYGLLVNRTGAGKNIIVNIVR